MVSQLFILRKEICNLLNQYEIPIDVKYFIIKDILSEIKDVIDNMVVTTAADTSEKSDETPQDISIDLKDIITEQASKEEWDQAKKKIDNAYENLKEE